MVNKHPAVAYSLNGQVEVYARSASNYKLYRVLSSDNGRTWNAWADIGKKTDQSPAVAITAEGRYRYLLFQLDLDYGDLDKKFLLTRTEQYGYDTGTQNLLKGSTSGPAVVCSPDGNVVHVFGLGNDNKVYWGGSSDRGQSWAWLWTAIGLGVFKSYPAAVMSANGQTILVFGIGNDNHCWYAQTTDGGKSWNVIWKPIGTGVFTSSPAACISADGKTIIVAARGNDNRIWFNKSTNAGQTWNTNFQPILEGVFTSGPGLCCSWDAEIIHVFGIGNDQKIWHAQSSNEGTGWQGWWAIAGTIKF